MKKNYVAPDSNFLALSTIDIITASSILDKLGTIIAGEDKSDPSMEDNLE